MSYLNKMYGRNTSPIQSKSDKNPNRVTGGLRAQGVDRFTMVAEDGSSREIPTVEYVRSLEEQSRKQRAAIDVLERKVNRQQKSLETLEGLIRNRNG